MLCPNCNNDHSKVIDSRPVINGTRRRRECNFCQKRWSTFETFVNDKNQITVIKNLIRDYILTLQTATESFEEQLEEQLKEQLNDTV